MHVCSRCGTGSDLKDNYCSVCGLHREGGKGKIFSSNVNKTSDINNVEIIAQELYIPDKIKRHKIWKFYDIDTLTQEIIDSELTRLHKEIEEIEKTLIYMEDKYPDNPDKIEFYKERDRIREQLDTIYNFLSEVRHERIRDDLKNDDLEMLYGRLPYWRVNQLKRKKSFYYYHFKFK